MAQGAGCWPPGPSRQHSFRSNRRGSDFFPPAAPAYAAFRGIFLRRRQNAFASALSWAVAVLLFFGLDEGWPAWPTWPPGLIERNQVIDLAFDRGSKSALLISTRSLVPCSHYTVVACDAFFSATTAADRIARRGERSSVATTTTFTSSRCGNLITCCAADRPPSSRRLAAILLHCRKVPAVITANDRASATGWPILVRSIMAR